MRVALIAIAAAVWIAAGVLLFGGEAHALELNDLEADELFDQAFLDRADDFRTGGRVFWVVEQAIQLVVLGLLVWKARPLAAWLGRWVPGRVRVGVLLAAGAVTAVWLAQLPVAAGRHAWRRSFDRTTQDYGSWFVDELLSYLVLLVLVCAAIAVFVWLAATVGRRWWLPGGALLAACGAAFALLQPLVIQPVFNDFRALDDPQLEAEIRAIGDRLDVEVDEVLVRDQSRRTRSANAMASGVGPTTRIVIDDTLLEGEAFTRGEVLVVAAHELAHVAGNHVWKAVAWFALLAIPAVALVAWVTRRRSPDGLADPAMVPLALLTVVVFALVTAPLQMAISREFEREADARALEATGDAAALENLIAGFVVTNLGDPTRPEWVRQLLGTHPSSLDRIAYARAFQAQRDG